MLICSAIGVRISQNIGSTILKRIFSAIPKGFRGSQNTFEQMGIGKDKSTILAVLVTALMII
jgi:hypothetical protein